MTDGFPTNSVERGRPVGLIAAALGVPEAVFRAAFTKVTPAAGGHEPHPAQVTAVVANGVVTATVSYGTALTTDGTLTALTIG